MNIKVRKIETRFMQGNIDVEGVLCNMFFEQLGNAAYESDLNIDEAIISNGFLKALQENKIPDFTTIKESNTFHNANSINQEYHHIIINDICYIVYFN
jgi:hypothetical protein